jgi:hypothetical protein
MTGVTGKCDALVPERKANLPKHLEHLSGVPASVNFVINGGERSDAHDRNGKPFHHDEAPESLLIKAIVRC